MTRKRVNGRKPKSKERTQLRNSRTHHKAQKNRRRINRKPSKRGTKRTRKAKRIRRRTPLTAIQIQSPEHTKALAALAYMRRENVSLAKAARETHIKANTVLRHVGSAFYRSGPGKPWKAANADSLRAQMRVLTPTGPVNAIVRSSRERKRLSQYEYALRQFRAGVDGAEKELEKFQGLSVGGHVLVTDLNQLIELEEAGKLDFDELYFSVGGGS